MKKGLFTNLKLGVITFKWENLAYQEEAEAVEMLISDTRTVSFTGPFGKGGNIILEGSLDGQNFFPLTDPQGNNVSKTVPSLESIVEDVRFVRPRVVSGDKETSITTVLFLRRI